MPIVNVNVKWSGKKFENLELGKFPWRDSMPVSCVVDLVRVDTDESPEVFKTQIYSQTGVPPERQKIMIKGGMLKVTEWRERAREARPVANDELLLGNN